MTRRQKILSLFLTAAVTVSSAVPAFAENTQDFLSVSGGDAAGEVLDTEEAKTIFTESSDESPAAEPTEDWKEFPDRLEEEPKAEEQAAISENLPAQGQTGFTVTKQFDETDPARLLSVCLEWPQMNRSYRWEVDTRRWYSMNGAFGASGVYVLGETKDSKSLSWHLDTTSANGAAAIPGYRWNAGSQAYEYYLDEADVGELEETFEDVPSAIYIGAKGDISKRSGWQAIDGKTCYLRENGKVFAGMKKIGSDVYDFGTAGEMLTGWQAINGKQYYFKKNGKRAGGWQTIDGERYYFNTKSGAMKTGLLKLNNRRYVLSEKGPRVKKGWATIGARTYYVDPKTGFAVVGWRTIGGKKYYFVKLADGRRASGWRKIDGARYYFNTKSGVMKTGLLTLNNKKYYFGKNGKLVTNKKILAVGKKYYRVNKNGVLTELTGSEAKILAMLKLEELGWNLKKAFDWSAGIQYVENDNTPPAGYTFAEHNAIYGFRNNAGNAQVMAATFYYMAKELGQDVHMVRGYIPLASGGMQPHAWCEITLNGAVYVFDPNFARATGKNGYQITYGAPDTWRYTGNYRLN